MKNRDKLLLVGWDAADWDVINPLLEKGALPTLQKLIKSGGKGNLATIDPPISPIVWTSIATGKRAYDHGITGFTEKSPEGKVRAVRGSSRKAKAFWNIVNEYGIKSHVIGWWPSHPAEKINGIMVSNFYGMAPPEKGNWDLFPGTVSPPEYTDELAELRLHPDEITSQIIAPFFPSGQVDSDHEDVVRSVIRIISHASSIHNAATWAMEKQEWDLTAVYYDALDHFKHLAMKYHPPQQKHISDQDFNKYHFIVESAYRFHDMMLERLIDLAGPQCTVMLVSDHGFLSGDQRKVNLPNEPGAPALEHSPYGIVCVSSPNHEMINNFYGASVLDICPTILNFYDIPVGEDMEGKPIDGFTVHKPTHVKSHESTTAVEFLKEDNIADAELLKTLEDLGYIERTEIEKTVDDLPENDFYKARSYWEGGHLESAEALFEKIATRYPEEGRYIKYWISICLNMGLFEKFELGLSKLKEHHNDTSILYFEGVYYLNQSKFEAAKTSFQNLLNSGLSSSHLYERIGQCYLQLQAFDVARGYFEKSLERHPKNERALLGMAEVYLEKGKLEFALEYLLELTQIRFQTPEAHYLIYRATKGLNLLNEAQKAIELCVKMNPHHPKYLKALSELTGQSIQSKPTIVVSGIPRSGTSLLMQMLFSGGVEIFDDGHRRADGSNERGYFEHESIKRLAADNSIIHSVKDRAVKVVFPLVRFLPPHITYKVLVVKRNLSSVVASQQKMKGDQDLNLLAIQKWEAEYQKNIAWLKRQDHIEFLEVSYEETLLHPAKAVTEIKKFLNLDLNMKAMENVVEPNLKHN